MPKTPIPFPLTDDSHATTFMIGSRRYAINIPTRYPDQKRTPAEVISIDVMQVDPTRDKPNAD